MRRSLRSWLWHVPLDQEVDEELAFHIEMRTRELVGRGLDPKAAREIAIRRLGDVATVKRACVALGRKRDREMRLTRWLEEFLGDATFAVRQLRRAPAFASVAAITLALGIGANSAMFALVDATLLRPLPFTQPERLVMIWERTATSPRSGVSPSNLLDWNERAQTFDRIAGYVPGVGGMVMGGVDGTAETVPRQWVTAGIFDVLGMKAILGRTFLPSDDKNRADVVVMSEAFWRMRFNADPAIVGRVIHLDGTPYTVVGIVPNDAQLIGRSSLWAMVAIQDPPPQARTAYMLEAIGRVKSGVTLEAASADLTAVAAALAGDYPKTNKGRGVTVEPIHDAMIGNDLRLTSLLFLGVVGFVLLICCANVANLLLARATVRTRELGVRVALGAGRRRVLRQLLTESLVLAAIGGVLGIAIGAAILRVAPAMVPEGLLPGAVRLTFDLRIVAVCAATSLVVGLLFGVGPAWHATELSTAQALASEGRTTTGRGGRTRAVLVVSEVAIAVILLFGGGLLLRTLLVVRSVDPGYRAESVLTMMVDPLGSRYPTDSALLQFLEAIEHEVAGLPGVRSLAWTSTLPMGPSDRGPYTFEIVGDAPIDERQRPTADYAIVSPGYFRTLDLAVVTGRGLTAGDRSDGVPVCMVNEAFVRDYVGGRSPIGLRVALRPASSSQAPPIVREIVGVVRQVKGRPDERADFLQIYVPVAQHPVDDIYLVIRPISGRADRLAPSVRGAIARIDKEQLVSVREVTTLEDIARDATARHRFRAVMVMTFAGLALLLAMVGVFGILAYAVQQRVRDFAVRRALGATSRDVLRMVVSSAVRVIAAGAIIGLALSAVLGRLLTTVLFGVQPLDPTTFACVTILVILTAGVSIAGPAWRATRIDPAAALRIE
jgi:putative ABC transport system permease protein